jgi:outer membrane protein assembly factor BamB
MEGKLLWKQDLGILDSGFFRVPKAQWGFASSPIIHEGAVVVQCDIQKGSFLAAFDVRTGKQIWRTERDEVPTWGTPTIYVHERQTRIVVNGYKHIGGYDFRTGREVWRMRGGGDIPVPTPVIARGLIFINNAHGRMSPIYAIKPGATGDISLKEDVTSNDHIAWSVKRGGSYMQTLLVVGEYLYNLRGNGALFCFRAETGEVVYRERVGEGASFSASPVAADGKFYLASENGNVYVVPSGPAFKLLATNPMGEICMATPAISGGVLFFRTHRRLVAVSGE